MKLKEYLETNKISQRQFAKRVKKTPLHIHMIVNEKSTPSPKLAFEIELATGGVVTRDESLYPKLYRENITPSQSKS